MNRPWFSRRARRPGAVFVLTVCIVLPLVVPPSSQAAPAKTALVGTDRDGDALPGGAITRLGTRRFRLGNPPSSGSSWHEMMLRNYLLGALSPDGKSVTILGANGVIQTVDFQTGRQFRHFDTTQDHPLERKGHFVAPDLTGTILAFLHEDGTLHFRDAASGRLLHRLTTECVLHTFLLSRHGKVLVAIRKVGDPLVSVFDFTTGKELAGFNPLYQGNFGLALSLDGDLLGVWVTQVAITDGMTEARKKDQERTLQILNPRTGKEVRRLQSREGAIVSATFTPDGKILALATTLSTVELWDVATGKRLRCIQARDGIGFTLAFSPDGKRLVGASRTGRVQGWDLATGKRLSLHDGPPCRFGSLAFASRERILACGIFRHALVVWDMTTGKLIGRPEGHQDQVEALRFTPDGKRLSSAGRDGRVLEWDVLTGRIVRKQEETLARHYFDPQPQSRIQDNLMPDGSLDYLEPVGFVFSPDGRRLVAIHDEEASVLRTVGLGGIFPAVRLLTLRERATGEKVFSVRGEDPDPSAIAFSQDGAYLAVALSSGDKNHADWPDLPVFPRIWDTRTGEQLPPLKGYKGKALSLALSPDGKKLAVESGFPRKENQMELDVHLQLWDVATGRAIRTFRGPRESEKHSLSFSPDRRLLAQVEVGLTAEESGLAGESKGWKTVRLLHATSGRRIHEFRVTAGITQPGLFSPDGRVLVTASRRKKGRGYEIALWETATGKRRKTFTGPEGEVTALAYSADGRLLASGHDDTTVLLWDVTGRHLAKAKPKKLPAPALAKLWANLESTDAEEAYRAVLALARSEAVSFLAARVRPVTAKAPDARQIDGWVHDFDDDHFPVRQRAQQMLEATGEAAVPALRRVLAGKPSLEMRRRAEVVLERILRTGVPPELVRPLRAVEALEMDGSAEALRVLDALSRGRPDARLTQEAKAALGRLSRTVAP